MGFLPVLLVLSRLYPVPDHGPPGCETHVRELWDVVGRVAEGRRRGAGHGACDEVTVTIQHGVVISGFCSFFLSIAQGKVLDVIVRD